MKKLITTTAVALLMGTAAMAQQEAGEQIAGEPFVAPDDLDVFASRLLGVAVYAPQDAAEADAIGEAADHVIDSAALADFVGVGRITDVMLSRDGELRAIVVALTGTGEAGVVGEPLPPGAAGAPGVAHEIALDPGLVRILSDETVPTLTFVVVGIGAEELQEGPPIARGEMIDGLTGPVVTPMDEPALTDWRAGRAPMTAPGVTMEGFTQVPVAEVSIDDLTGAPVFDADRENIGSVGDVVLDAAGAVDHVVVDVGGFLGIGAREVAIGFDEITILRDAGWADLQVHVDATRAMLEDMPEYQRDL